MLRLLRTLRYLKLRQIVWRLYRMVRRVKLRPVAASQRIVSDVWSPPTEKPSGMQSPLSIRVLNKTINIGAAACWNDTQLTRLVLYNLHYLDELNAVVQIGSNEFRFELLKRWIGQNLPMKGVGWEPYPLSLRIVNIVKWALGGGDADDSIIKSLHQQAQALSQQVEYHILGNHLLANAKALIFVGCFFEGRDARRWLQKGVHILAAEVDEQILSDGGHFERSPMYQAIILEDFLDLINLTRTYELVLPVDLTCVVERMMEWLDVMTHRDGEVAYFNDSTAGASVTLKSLRDYSERLKLSCHCAAKSPVRYLETSGYVRRTTGNISLLIDVGEIGSSYQPGHAHCDCLSFEMTIGNDRVLVNTGVSTYEVGARRNLERSTPAHNTVSVNGAEQSEIWGAFRVGRRAFPSRVIVSDEEISAQHDGFRYLGVFHHRSFQFLDSRIVIVDTLTGEHAVHATGVAYFHFHPSVTLRVDRDIVNYDGGTLVFSGHENVDCREYDYCQSFNRIEPATLLAVRFKGTLQTAVTFTSFPATE